MKNRSISILLLVLLTASMLLITGCPRVQNKVPIVNKVSGPSGTITQSSTTFSWTGNDSDGTITKYEYRKDEGSWVSNGTSTSYTWSDYLKGDHIFEVRAQDNEGAYSEIIVWSFNYDPPNVPPAVTKIGGHEGETEESSNAFSWTGNDPDGEIVRYEIRKDSGEWVDAELSTEYTWNDYYEGEHTFEVRAQDNEGAYSNIISWSFTYSTGTIVVGEMVLVEGGAFTMGDEFGDLEEWCRPVHQVTLTYDFEIGKYEVTFDEYDAFCEATGRSTSSDYGWGRGTRPVINVSWWDAIAYCNWLSARNGLPIAYRLAGEENEGQLLDSNGNVTTDLTKVVGYRLPTEAEWEYAARGGKYNSPYKYSGSDYVDEVAWYFSNSGDKTQEVGKKAPNELGIYDMSGNAWEWCSDWFDGYSTLEQTNPYNSEERFSRVGRGGGWIEDKIYSRVAYRHPYVPCYEFCDLGFRVCRISSSLNQLPVVSIIEGPDGEVSESSSTFTWNGSDSDGTITKYEYRKDGGSWVSNGTSTSYTWSGYSIGEHTFEVRAQDDEGAYSNIIIWNFTYAAVEEVPYITWQKCLGGSSLDDVLSIQQTSDGGYIVAGYTGSDDGDVSGKHGDLDFWVVKLSSTGSLQWQKCLGGSSLDDARSIQQTSDGGYVVAGYAYSNDGDVSGNHGNAADFWVVKLSSTGSLQWQKCLGGSGWDFAHSIQQTSDGGYIVAGSTNSNDGDVSGNHGNAADFWVVKLSSTGSLQWQKCLGGSGDDDGVGSIQQTSDGGYIVAGVTWSNDGDVSGNHGNAADFWVVKLSSTGSLQWQKCLGGSGDDGVGSIQQTSDGGYIVAGVTWSNDGDVSGNHGNAADFWVVKLSSTGSLQWQKCLGGSGDDGVGSIQQTSDGGYIIAGVTWSNDGDVSGNHGNAADFWVVKLSSTGSLQWQKCLGGSGDDGVGSIQQTSDGGYIVAGSTNSNDGDVSGNHGDLDFWVVKLD